MPGGFCSPLTTFACVMSVFAGVNVLTDVVNVLTDVVVASLTDVVGTCGFVDGVLAFVTIESQPFLSLGTVVFGAGVDMGGSLPPTCCCLAINSFNLVILSISF